MVDMCVCVCVFMVFDAFVEFICHINQCMGMQERAPMIRENQQLVTNEPIEFDK